MPSVEPAPFKLRWVGQGRVAWRRDWVDSYGPTRSHIPDLTEHIGFANFDLGRNDLPTISTDDVGDLYIMSIPPLTDDEMAAIYLEIRAHFRHPEQREVWFADVVMRPLAKLASALDFAAYHGFAPAEDSPGLRQLRKLFPPFEHDVEFPDGPGAGL